MIVTFSSQASGNITMFGDVAIQLIKMMGHSGSVPSAILAKDIAGSLSNLRAAIDSEKRQPDAEVSDDEDEDEDETSVNLAHRALPLIEMLEIAAKEDCNVMWSDK